MSYFWKRTSAEINIKFANDEIKKSLSAKGESEASLTYNGAKVGMAE